MPYSSMKDLPESVRNNLPAGGQRIYRSAFNAALKSYNGDEEKASKVSWAAVKRRYKKQGDKWVAKARAQDAVADVQRLYEAHWTQNKATARGEQEIRDLLSSAKLADQPGLIQQITEIDVPHFELAQIYSHEHDFPGSLDHRIRMVSCAIRDEGDEYLGRWGTVLAVYPDFAVVCSIDDGEPYYGMGGDYWKIDYQFDPGTMEVTLGDVQEVEVLTVVLPRTMEDGAEEPMESASQNTPPQEDGAADTDASSDASEGKPKFDFSGALNEDPQWHTTPEWIAQGQPPPGGEEELVQTLSATITQKKIEKGVMHVQGIATVGNVVNAMGEVYPTQVWEDNMPALQAEIERKALVGESDHPNQTSSLDRTCIAYDKLWMDGDRVMFEARVLPTKPSGENLQILLENDVRVDISSRGRGTRKKGDWVNPATGERYQDVFVVQRGFRCKAFDAVVQGASPGATITDRTMAQQTDANLAANVPEEVDVEKLDSLAQQVEQLAAQQTQIAEILAKLSQGNAPAPAETPAGGGTATAVAEPPVQTQAIPTTDLATLAAFATMNDRQKRLEPILIAQRTQQLLDEARTQHNMPQQWLNSYRKAMEVGEPKTVEELEDVAQRALPIILSQYDARPRYPGGGHTVQQDAGERPGPQTPEEMLDFLVKDMPDESPFNWYNPPVQDANGNLVQADDYMRTPRRQLRKVLENIANYQDKHFSGPAALMAYTRLWQGHSPDRVQEGWMKQACADGVVSVAAGGAPVSAHFIFPLIRAVYPQLIANEICSIQPMDRPDGKIFFLNALRIQAGMNVTDQAGDTLTNRQFMDNSSSFSSSYSDRAAECDEAVKITLQLASVNVTAQSKAVTTSNTIEELQDLRAYHGLDINSELMALASREIAIEWNLTILNEMAAGATAGTLQFGTVNATGYTQKEWSEYIGRYVSAASNRIFRKRMGEATHLIAGPSAWERLSAAFRVGTNMAGANPTMFAGLTLTPFMNGAAMNLKCYKTAFWNGANEDIILLIRRGVDWSDTGYVFGPYVDWISPILTLPDTYVQRQGVMSRAAHRVVVGDAMSKIQIVPGATGVEL